MSDWNAPPISGPQLPQLQQLPPGLQQMLAQQLGLLGSSVQGPLSVSNAITKNADWGKFEREARPSTNIDDTRARDQYYQSQYPVWFKLLWSLMPGMAADKAVNDVLYK